MSIIQYSPQDINKLADRLSKLESDIKALKLEKKVHHSAIKDGAIRILDASSNEVARLGRDGSDYGIWLKDTSGNVLFKSIGTITELINVLIKEGILNIKDNVGVIRAQFGKIGTKYGVRINDASGNLLINLYDPANYEIKAPVKIVPAWDGTWQASGGSGTYILRTHNLGYFPSSAQLWGGSAGLVNIYDESFYASMDISWISTSQVRLYFLNNASHGLPPYYRIVLFR